MKIRISRTESEAAQQQEIEQHLCAKYRIIERKGPVKAGESPHYRTYYTLEGKVEPSKPP